MLSVAEPAALPAHLRNGVRFACTQCGACCTGAPGRVRLTPAEWTAIKKFLGGPEAESRYLRNPEPPLQLREKENGDCVFYENGGCRIHPVKPSQCRTYPFWFANVRSEAAWAETRRACPGIGEGPLIPPEEILKQVQEDLAQPQDESSPGPV